MRLAWLALGLVVLLSFLPSSLAQRRARPISVAHARRNFDEFELAYRELRAVDVQPADASGAVAAWDRRWERRLDRLRLPNTRVCGDATTSCDAHERNVLACGVAEEVLGARRSIYATELDQPLVDPFAWRRAVADEDARRREAGLSCEDLPFVSWALRDAPGGGFETHFGLLIPPATSRLPAR